MLAQITEGAATVAQSVGFSPVVFAANLGVAGLMLYWFAIRMERLHESTRIENGQRVTESNMRTAALEKSVDRLAKAQLLTLISLGQMDSVLRDQAQQFLDEINNKEARG